MERRNKRKREGRQEQKGRQEEGIERKRDRVSLLLTSLSLAISFLSAWICAVSFLFIFSISANVRSLLCFITCRERSSSRFSLSR